MREEGKASKRGDVSGPTWLEVGVEVEEEEEEEFTSRSASAFTVRFLLAAENFVGPALSTSPNAYEYYVPKVGR